MGEEGDDLGADCVQPLDDLRLQDREVGEGNTISIKSGNRQEGVVFVLPTNAHTKSVKCVLSSSNSAQYFHIRTGSHETTVI